MQSKEINMARDRAYSKRYYLNNKDDYRKKRQKRKESHPYVYKPRNIKAMLRNAKAGAKKKNLEFNITVEDIIIPEHCPYLGIKLDDSLPYTDNTPSLDRMDNTKGYVKGNVMVISLKANLCKSSLTIPMLKTFAQNILRLLP